MAATPAFAQPSDQQKIIAGDLVKKAIAKTQAGDHEGAIKLYLDAYTIAPNPILLSNIASAYKAWKKPVEALKYFCMYLEKDPTGAMATYATSEATILHMELAKSGDVCKPEPVKKDPPIITPPKNDNPTPDNGITGTAPQPKQPGGGMRIAGLAVTGAGALSLGVGVFYGLKAKKNSDLITNHNMNEEWPANIKQIEADGEAFEKRQIIFLAAGGALVATGVIVYFIGRSKKAETSATVTPTATPNSVGVTLRGSF